MKKTLLTCLTALVFACTAHAQINTQKLLDIGRNALYFEDYVVAIGYFNQVIKAKPYLTEPYLLRAYAKLNLEDYSGAIRDCNSSLEINPFQSKAYFCRGYSLLQTGKRSKAIEDFRKALKFEPGNINATNLLIETLLMEQRAEEALAICDSFATQYPRFQETYLIRSQVYLQRGDTVAALADLNKVINLNKGNDVAYAIRGMIAYEQQHYPEALADLDEAIRLNAFRSEFFGNRAIIRMKMNNLRGAMEDFDTAVRINPQNPGNYFNRGLLRENVGDENRAEEDFTTCITLDATNYTALLQRALLRNKLGKYEEALQDFNIILQRYPDFIIAYYGRAESKKKLHDRTGSQQDLYLADKIEEEIMSGKRKPQQGKESEIPIASEGQAMVQQVDQKRSERYKSDIRGQVQYKHQEVEPLPLFTVGPPDSVSTKNRLFNAGLDDFTRRHNLPFTFCLYRMFEENAKYLEQRFQNVEKATVLLQADSMNTEALELRAMMLVKIQDYGGAREDFDRLLRIHPDNALYYFFRGITRVRELQEAGEDHEPISALHTLAINDFLMAYHLDSTLVYALYNAAYAYMEQRNFQQALRYYSQAIEAYPDFAEAYYNRGLIYLYQGDKEKGRADLSRAGELGLHGAYNIIRRYAF